MAGSWIWKKIRPLSVLIQKERKWTAGNGTSISLWYGNWLDKDPIAHKFPHLHFSVNDLVVDLIQRNSWTIPSHLPTDLKTFLLYWTNLLPLRGHSTIDTLSWQGNSSGILSLKEAWNMMRSTAVKVVWAGLIWTRFVSPCLACFSWRLRHRKTPTESWVKNKGICLASICYSCFNSEENDFHLFFSCNIDQQLWSWLLCMMGSVPPPPFSPSLIWKVFANNGDAIGRSCAAAIFFNVISVLWSLRNDSKHDGKKPSMHRAKLLLMDRLKGMAISQSVEPHPLPSHPILGHFGLVERISVAPQFS